MALLRSIQIPCPYCGQASFYVLAPPEDSPFVQMLTCDQESRPGCGLKFAVEVTLQVAVTVSTCRLTLPSTRQPGVLEELVTLPEPPDASDF